MAKELINKFDKNKSGGLDKEQAKTFITQTLETTFEIAIARFSEEEIEFNGGYEASKKQFMSK